LQATAGAGSARNRRPAGDLASLDSAFPTWENLAFRAPVDSFSVSPGVDVAVFNTVLVYERFVTLNVVHKRLI
jgi:hypothetical protein